MPVGKLAHLFIIEGFYISMDENSSRTSSVGILLSGALAPCRNQLNGHATCAASPESGMLRYHNRGIHSAPKRLGGPFLYLDWVSARMLNELVENPSML